MPLNAPVFGAVLFGTILFHPLSSFIGNDLISYVVEGAVAGLVYGFATEKGGSGGGSGFAPGGIDARPILIGLGAAGGVLAALVPAQPVIKAGVAGALPIIIGMF